MAGGSGVHGSRLLSWSKFENETKIEMYRKPDRTWAHVGRAWYSIRFKFLAGIWNNVILRNDRLEYKLDCRKKTGENGAKNWRRSQDYSEISLTTRRTPSCFWLIHRSCTNKTDGTRRRLCRSKASFCCPFPSVAGFTEPLHGHLGDRGSGRCRKIHPIKTYQ